MIGNDWDSILKEEYNKQYFIKLKNYVLDQYTKKTIFPKLENVFNAFKLTPYKDIKVVIIGQDPYHDVNQAEGLAFSVKEGVRFPPSLINIFKELNNDLGYPIPKSGSLKKWCSEGVLLLNTILTVEAHKPLSHKNIGWEIFIDNIIKLLNNHNNPIVFILWGNNARNKKRFLTNKKHLILEARHPSPLSSYTGFFGTKPFSKSNAFLIKNDINPIDWNLN